MKSLREKYRRCCARLGQEPKLHVTSQHDGSPHVELVGGQYHYVVTERGEEYSRRVAVDEDELLFWLVSDLVSELAGRHELAHRVPGRSFRRLLFGREIELLEQVNPAWAGRRRREIEAILAGYPYDDEAEG